MAEKKKTEKDEKKVDNRDARILELEASIEFSLDLMDSEGNGTPEPGSPGYMIDVVKTLRGVCPAKS